MVLSQCRGSGALGSGRKLGRVLDSGLKSSLGSLSRVRFLRKSQVSSPGLWSGLSLELGLDLEFWVKVKSRI